MSRPDLGWVGGLENNVQTFYHKWPNSSRLSTFYPSRPPLGMFLPDRDISYSIHFGPTLSEMSQIYQKLGRGEGTLKQIK